MAKKITLTSGSILAGNPITLSIQPEVLKSPTFHRVIVEVTFSNLQDDYETVALSVPVTQEKEGAEVSLDISSAIRIPMDSYTYSPLPATYPKVSWYVRAYDEYMDSNGRLHTGTDTGAVYFPQAPLNGINTNLRCIAGAFNDMERLKAGVTKAVTNLSAKPTSSPEPFVVGESFIYPVPYAEAQTLAASATLAAPASSEAVITQKGMQTVNDHHPIYALPDTETENRTTFRFINRFGCLESINVPKSYSQKMSADSASYTIAKQETFNEFSHFIIHKQNDRESWLFQTDPLDYEWIQWYYHEFLMAKHVWLKISDTWVPCTIALEDEITIKDDTAHIHYAVSFTATLGINGSPVI